MSDQIKFDASLNESNLNENTTMNYSSLDNLDTQNQPDQTNHNQEQEPIKQESHEPPITPTPINPNKQFNTERKRKYDGENNQTYKRLNNAKDQSDDSDVYFKLLIPSSLAGSVIGRGGERIAQIQKDANVRIKMSKATEHYPNTNERVCLIIGSVKSVLKAHELIVEKIQEKPETSKQHESDLYERVNQIKLLVPNSTAGLIIGKAGVFIKQIKDDSGAFVQISSKQTDLPERVVSIEGDVDKRYKALCLVIKKIADDPLHNTVPTLNYSSLMSNPQNQQDQYPSNNSSNQNQQSGQNPNQANKFDFNSIANYLAGLNNLALLIINCGGSFQMTAESLKVSLRSAGYSSSASMEIIDAITVLLSYGLVTKTSPAALLAANPGVAGMGNMSNITNAIAASMASTMGNMNSNPSQPGNSYGNPGHQGHGGHQGHHGSHGSHGNQGNNYNQYYHGHMNGSHQNGHHSKH